MRWAINPSSKILVTGANGQLGRAICESLARFSVTPATRNELDLGQLESIQPYLDQVSPSVIFNTAAYTQVDLAETQNDVANRVNHLAPVEMARWCKRNHVPLIHFSTDYVFSGQGQNPHIEDERLDPINFYGKTKALGESGIQELSGKYLIFRTSWVYDSLGKNFLNTMLKLGMDRETLRVVHDQIGAPTYAPDLAYGAIWAYEKSIQPNLVFPSGVYHLCNQGETSWHGFACAIFKTASELGWELKVKNVEPITSLEFPTPAKRPSNSRLSTLKYRKTFETELSDWQTSLRKCLELKRESSHR